MGILLKQLKALQARYRREDDELGDIAREFWANGGICCPGCGVPGYSERERRQERREQRITELKAKIARDANTADFDERFKTAVYPLEARVRELNSWTFSKSYRQRRMDADKVLRTQARIKKLARRFEQVLENDHT